MVRFAAVRTVGVLLAASVFTVASGTARADEILLKGGGRLTGVVVEKTDASVTVECSPGRVTLPLSRVVKISQAPSSLEAWRERAAAVAPGDVQGWAALARWAEQRELGTQARECWQRVLALAPGEPEANAALGRVALNGAWMSREDAWRAQGYVEYEGRWVTPAERAALLEERRTEEAMALQRREAELRAREADARAREAEARARQAEGAGAGADEGGIPLWWGGGYGGYAGYGPGVGRPGRPHDDGHRGEGHGGGHAGRPAATAPAPPSTPPSSIGTSTTQLSSGGASGSTQRPRPSSATR